MNKLTKSSPEIAAFIKALTERTHAEFDKNFPSLEKPLYVCERGTKFLAIDVISYPSKIGKDDYTGRSVFCFIAADDTESKSLGSFKRGDICKADGYKKPAKYARGNIFNADMLKGTNTYGTDYLR